MTLLIRKGRKVLQIYYDDDTLPESFKSGTVIALGDFDALHIAHRQLISCAVRYGQQRGLTSGVFLFDRRPGYITCPDQPPASLYTNADKEEIIAGMGAEFSYFATFSENFRRRSARDFAGLMKEKFFASCLVVGFDYRFGYNAEGDAGTLKELGLKLGFDVRIIEPVKIGQVLVSSTYIRSLITRGDVTEAARFLGRYYSISGKVMHDRGVGRRLSLPTANIVPDPSLIRPAYGVYATLVNVGEKRYIGVTNVGVRPTFSLSQYCIETHIPDFDLDLYDQNIKIEFVRRLRGEVKFESPEALTSQITKDIRAAKTLLKHLHAADG